MISKLLDLLVKKKPLTPEQFGNTKAIYKRRCCAHCSWNIPALSWWCHNEEAIEARGTRIPGIYGCPHWAPHKGRIKKDMDEGLYREEESN